LFLLLPCSWCILCCADALHVEHQVLRCCADAQLHERLSSSLRQDVLEGLSVEPAAATSSSGSDNELTTQIWVLPMPKGMAYKD
jgi:hypothetical protein